MIAAFFVFLGGGIGAVLRFLISKSHFIILQRAIPFKYITFKYISMFNCWIISYCYFISKSINPNVKFFVLIGLCGGLSTFSTFSLETLQLLKSGNYYWAFANIILSIVVCFGLLIIFL